MLRIGMLRIFFSVITGLGNRREFTRVVSWARGFYSRRLIRIKGVGFAKFISACWSECRAVKMKRTLNI
jgi:hypothetical protein